MSSSITQPRVPPSLRERLRVWLAVPLLALLGHAALICALVGLSTLTATVKPPKKVSRPVSLRKIDARRWAVNRGKTTPAESMLEKPAELHPKGQVVDVAAGNEQLSPDAKYLAETNNRVQKQTVAKEQTNKYSKATPKTTANPMAMPMAHGRAAPSLLGTSPAELFTSPLGMRPKLSELFQKSSQGHDDTAPETSAVGSQASNEPPVPGSEATEGGGAPNDDLHDVAQGDGTFLNTREWKFAAFFNRVKQAVSAQWDPNGRMRAKGRQLGAVERKTVMHVALRPDGSIADLFVRQSSGVDELDQEAMKAFEKAQPFPNPPAALVENGFIAFEFGFLVSNEGMGGFGSPQFFRMNR